MWHFDRWVLVKLNAYIYFLFFFLFILHLDILKQRYSQANLSNLKEFIQWYLLSHLTWIAHSHYAFNRYWSSRSFKTLRLTWLCSVFFSFFFGIVFPSSLTVDIFRCLWVLWVVLKIIPLYKYKSLGFL